MDKNKIENLFSKTENEKRILKGIKEKLNKMTPEEKEAYFKKIGVMINDSKQIKKEYPKK